MQERKRRPPLRKAEPKISYPKPRTPEEEETLACGLAMDTAIRWMSEGTAPAQVVCHFLKIQSTREKIELQKLKADIKLSEAKCENLEIARDMEKKVDAVIAAIRSYSGKDDDWETIPDDYPDDTMDYRP